MELENSVELAGARVLAAALPHVPFDGWSESALRAAISDSGVAEGLARALYPRGGVDLAVAYHRRGDAQMQERLAAEALAAMKIRERISLAVRLRLEVADQELVRRGAALFALPQHAAEGTRLIWGTADAIWLALGDTAQDLNWYTKRATLSAVYASTVLFWLGDTSPGQADTSAFLDRRIADVMQIEQARARLRESGFGKALRQGPLRLLERIRAPRKPADLPGRTNK